MEENIKILLCEDDENLGTLLREYLQAKGCETDLQQDGEAGYRAFLKNKYDICILDVMMPLKDGLQLAQDIRQVNADMPIIFLTAKTLRQDIFEGFKAGADDYITKPFSMEELLYRIQAILRRVNSKKSDKDGIYHLGSLLYNSQKQTLTPADGETISLTTKENDLLALLCENANKILERSFALKSIWIDDNFFNARSMDVYITKLRKLLRSEPSVEIINIHGKGYKIIIPENNNGNA